ncbi:coiled-coil domain-containing protein-domain-containing protein [Hypoxylon sp. FL1284]|nr:coiled-coil domain-containing protein-domain-containing protein [Hypoxylon sp. FL1284]
MMESPGAAADASPMPPQPPPSPPRSSSSSPSPTSTYVKPQPRPPKSPAHAAQIRVQNRRREYLERHPKYFESLEHELADPLLYDALIRRFQSAEEREKEGRAKGYSRVLELDLLRGEAKLAQLASASTPAPPSSSSTSQGAPRQPENSAAPWLPVSATADADAFIREYASGGDFDGSRAGGAPQPRRPETREEGRGRWEDFLRRRFVLGRDDDFDYGAVDEDDDLDAVERRELQDAWFDDEDPGWASDSPEAQAAAAAGDAGAGSSEKKRKEKRLEGETGIQDF